MTILERFKAILFFPRPFLKIEYSPARLTLLTQSARLKTSNTVKRLNTSNTVNSIKTSNAIHISDYFHIRYLGEVSLP